MLILRRGVGERIMIGPDVVITVTRLKSGSVSLGIEAPREVAVHRGEVRDRITIRRPETGGGAHR
jgi:carbon storage regulator